MSPGEAIRRGQVWLRPFAEFLPADQGYMGFNSEEVRDEFLNEMEDGALVVIWIRQDGSKDWRGRFRGILRLERRAVLASDHSTAGGEAQRHANKSEYLHAVPMVQTWEADPARNVMMKGIIPSLWPDHARSIGVRSRKMDPGEIPNILSRRIREIGVFGRPPVIPGAFDTVKNLMT